MPAALNDDITLILMQKIQERSLSDDYLDEQFINEQWIGIPVTGKDILEHLEYLEDNGYIRTDSSQNLSGQPSSGKSDDSTSPILMLHEAELTEKGMNTLEELKRNHSHSKNQH